MSPLKIGMIDLDTSHPAAWLPIIRSLGHDVTAVFDGGTVHPSGYAEKFARNNDVALVCSSLEEMVDQVDLAIIHSCNWDMHIERGRPFAEAGKGIFFDKPIAGNMRDLMQMSQWHQQGVRLAGGSSLRYCKEITDWLEGHKSSEILFAHSGCSVDEFNYGIHAYSLLHGLMGTGIESVRHLSTRIQHHIEITWVDGRTGIVNVGATSGYLPFYATLVTASDVSQFIVDNSRIYGNMLEKVLPYFDGTSDEPVPFHELIEVELAAIAARISWQTDGRRVYLKDIPHYDQGYDGEGFSQQYKRQFENTGK